MTWTWRTSLGCIAAFSFGLVHAAGGPFGIDHRVTYDNDGLVQRGIQLAVEDLTIAAVTPFMLEYGRENPWVYGLAALPAYDAVARVKVQGHWQSDVIAGAALGFAAGFLAHQQDNPFILHALPGGFEIGFRKRF